MGNALTAVVVDAWELVGAGVTVHTCLGAADLLAEEGSRLG